MRSAADNDVHVSCHATRDGWSCDVRVSDGRSSTDHVVTVSRGELVRYGQRSEPAEKLVERAFRFLLVREPKESILRRFSLAEIERYFPEFARP